MNDYLAELGLSQEADMVNQYLTPEEEVEMVSDDTENEPRYDYYIDIMKADLEQASKDDILMFIKKLSQYGN